MHREPDWAVSEILPMVTRDHPIFPVFALDRFRALGSALRQLADSWIFPCTHALAPPFWAKKGTCVRVCVFFLFFSRFLMVILALILLGKINCEGVLRL